MNKMAIAIAITTMLMSAGCKNQPASTSAGSTSAASATSVATNDPEQLGRIGAELKKHPGQAEKILSEHGMDHASFEKAIRTVSSDPAASRKYRDAYRKAGA